MIGIRARPGLIRAALAASAVTLLLAGSAHAATFNLGSAFSSTYTSAFTANAQTVAHTALPPPMLAASPVDGTLISWRFAGTGPFTPRVLRPAGGNVYTGAGTGVQQSGPSPTAVHGPFPLSLPIRRGDVFGVNTMPMSGLRQAMTPGTTRLGWAPPLADGETREASLNVTTEWAIGAVVRYCLVPNLLGLKPSAVSGALAAADCTAGTGRKAKKRRKKKKVLSQAFPPGTSISDTAPVDFTFSPKKKKKRKKRKKR